MHVLTSSDILSRISRYQDGCCARDLKYQPDKLAKNGHFNLINEESFYRPTPQAYEKILESGSVVNPDSNPSNSIEKLHYLLNVLKIPFSFLIGDSACLHGNNDALHFLLHYTKAPIHTLISYKGVLNAATKGHLGILKFLNPHYNLHSTEALHLAMCNKHKHIVDWYILSNEVTVLHGVVPSSMLYSALVYYIELGEVDTCLRIMTGNPVLLCIQKRSTKAVDMCASRGNLELLKILFAYHGRESHNALDKAAANGHLEIVKYLTGNSDRTSLHPTLDELHRSHDSTSSLNSSLNSSLGTNLGSVGQLHAPRLMLSSTSNSRSDLNVLPPRNSSSDLNIMDRSAVSSHLHSRTPTPNGVESPRHKGKYTIHASKNAITQACCNGHIDVVEYLLFNRFEG